jgi:hypothetical protein
VTAKSSDLADWAIKRGQNLNRMIEEAGRDDRKLFQCAADLLDTMAKLLHGVGDEAGSLYASSLARRLENKKLDVVSASAPRARGSTPF